MAFAAKDANAATQNFSTTTDVGGNLVGATCVTDPGASGTKQNVKAASTPSVPGDTAAVVAVRPDGAAFFNDAVAGTVVQVKSAAGALYALSLVNTTAATAYLQIFFLPSAGVTLGTTVAPLVIRLAASAAVQLSFPVGVGASGTGLSLAGTTTATGLTGAAVSVAAVYV